MTMFHPEIRPPTRGPTTGPEPRRSGDAKTANAPNQHVPMESQPSSAQEAQEIATVRAMMNSLRGDFAEIGMVPPPRNFAGMALLSHSELSAVEQQGPENSSKGPEIGTLDRMRILMVKSIVAKLVHEKPQSVEPTAVSRAPEPPPPETETPTTAERLDLSL